MIVFIKYEQGIRRIDNITLLGGYIPKCRHVTVDGVNPALWYKVLVVGSILVDCDRKNVFWRRAGNQERDNVRTCHASELNTDTVLSLFEGNDGLFQEDECHDFDMEFVELFETAVDLYQSLSWESIDREGNTKPYENVLKMLHVHIWPILKLTVDDRADLERALREVEKHQKDIENQMRQKDRVCNSLEDQLHEQRIQLLQDGDFSKSSYVVKCDPDFLNVFLVHLEKFTVKCNDDFFELQKKIDPIRDTTCSEIQTSLDALRKERNKLFETITKAVNAREEIKQVVARNQTNTSTRRKSKKISHKQMDAYVKVSERLKVAKDKIKPLIATKIKISIVREAVDLTLKEVGQRNSSYGYSCGNNSFRIDTDLLHSVSKPETWNTLPEKVSHCLQINQGQVTFEHEKFCQRVELQCRQLCDESKLFSFPAVYTEPSEVVKPETHGTDRVTPDTTSAFLRHQGVKSSPSTVTNSQASRCSLALVSKEKCRGICEEIVDHIEHMTYILAKALHSGDTLPNIHFLKKVYICYEKYVSSILMSVLNTLYQQVYRDDCPGLSAWLRNARLSDNEKTLFSIVKPSRFSKSESLRRRWLATGTSVDENPIQESSTENKESRIEACTDEVDTRNEGDIHELYKMYNQMADEIPQTFTAAFDMESDLLDQESLVRSDPGSTDPLCNGDASCGSESCMSATHGDTLSGVLESDFDLKKIKCDTLRRFVVPIGGSSLTSSQQRCNNRNTNSCTKLSLGPTLSERFNAEFSEFESFITELEVEVSLFRKLHKVKGTICYVQNSLVRLKKDCGIEMTVTTDDVVDVITILLCQLDAPSILRWSAQVDLMMDLKPNFLQETSVEYSVVTLQVALQHLFQSFINDDQVTRPGGS